ncbi:hypothetical protein CASFOL_001362 [Castilleja foliolosa]|uniref:Uncharacterized protein n=1 Tax=Castilleja foliolosa TaxID=1961234 RepID=A0ABD3EN10_9LAMI
MASLLKHGWATRFSLLRRISDLTSIRKCGDRNLGSRMMSMAVNSTPSSSPSRVMSPPWLMLPPVIEDGGDTVYKFYNLLEDKEESFPRNSGEEMADDVDAKFVGSSSFPQLKPYPILIYMNFTPDGRGSVSKLILSSSPDDDDECIAMMTYGPGERLAFYHPCRSTKWTPVAESYLSCG